MRLRSFRTFCIVGALAVLAGCDPADLVKSKVPGPIKDLLTIEGLGRPDPNKPIATIDLVQPKPNSVHGSRDAIKFEAKVDTGKVKFPKPPVVSWRLTSLADKKQKPLGSGANVSKKLEPGRYDAEISVEALGKKVSKKVAFRVVHQMPGKVVDSEDKGVPGVDIVVTDREGTSELSRTQTDAKGMFKIEVPAKGVVQAKPEKAGFSFYPAYQVVRFSAAHTQTEFRAIEGNIRNIRLADAKNPSVAAAGLCPGEQALVSFEIKSRIPVKSYDIALVRGGNEAEQVVRLEHVGDTAAPQGASESRTLKVSLPENVRLNNPIWTGHLRVTVTNEKGDRFAVDAHEDITVDLTECFTKIVTRANAALSDGKLEEAGKDFDFAERLGSQLEGLPTVNTILHNINLNRVLALLIAAQAEKPRSQRQKNLVEKASATLNNLLKHKTEDDRAMFLKGLADYLSDDYKAALKDVDAALAISSDNTEAHLLRAFAAIKTGIKNNVSLAVDDLTRVLTADPGNNELRRTRAAALRVVAEFQDRGDNEQVDVGEIPVPNFAKTMDLKKYVRK